MPKMSLEERISRKSLKALMSVIQRGDILMVLCGLSLAPYGRRYGMPARRRLGCSP